MRSKKFALIFCSFFVLSLPAAQAEQTLDTCLEQAANTTGMAKCTVSAYQVTDKRLNSLYQAVLQNQDAKGKKSLLNAQLAWLKFRDAHCGFLTERLTGDDKKYLLNRCLNQLTEERNGHLNEMLISP